MKNNDGIQVNETKILKLNVGGDMFNVTRNILTQVKGSILEIMFSGRWGNIFLRDENGLIFIDSNPYCFQKIMV